MLRKTELNRVERNRQATLALGGQPISLASTADGTLFVLYAEKTGKTTIQAVRRNQTVYTLRPTYKAVSVAASGTVVVVGGEVRTSVSGRVTSRRTIHPEADVTTDVG